MPLDFSRVTEMDSGPANTFKRVVALAERGHFVVIFSSDAPPNLPSARFCRNPFANRCI